MNALKLKRPSTRPEISSASESLPCAVARATLVLQEFYALLLAHYAVRSLMLRAAQSKDVDPDRISFTGTIQVLGQAIVQSSLLSPEQTFRVLKRICADLTSPGALVAPRRLRFNCRVVKHICTRFRRKRPEHHNVSLKHTSFADILLI